MLLHSFQFVISVVGSQHLVFWPQLLYINHYFEVVDLCQQTHEVSMAHSSDGELVVVIPWGFETDFILGFIIVL